MPRRSLPTPEGWRTRRALIVLAIVCTLALFGSAVWWTVVTLVRGSYLTAFITLSFALFTFGVAVGCTLTHAGWIESYGEFDEQGTYVFVDLLVARIFLVATIVFIPAGILFAIFSFFHQLDFPETSPRRHGSASVGVLFAVIAAIGLVRGYPKRAMGQVRLTPKGFRVFESGKEFGGAWADVEDVSSYPPPKRKHKMRTHKPVVLTMTDGDVHVISGANAYTPGGAALYWMIRYYWRNPDERRELTDGRALTRMYAERFPTD